MFEDTYQNKNILNNKIVQDNMDNFSTDKNSTEDIFSTTEYQDTNKILKPNGIAPRSPITNYQELVREVDETQSDKIRPKYFFIGLIVLILIFASFGFYIYTKFFTKKNDSGDIFLDNKAQTVDILQNVTSSDYFADNVGQNTIQDSDGDGLSDQEEELLKTDKNKIDTDEDGLSDKDEVKKYKTDPLNPDSDGDGYLDGDEVKNGYDPMGPGKLLNFDFLTSSSESDSISTALDISNWISIGSYISSLKTNSFINPAFDFKYPSEIIASIDNKQIVLSGQDFKVYFEIKDNKLELDLSDWVMTQSEFSLSTNDPIDISNFEARIATVNNQGFKKMIFIADKSLVYIFKYFGDINSSESIDIFKSIASSFNIK